MISVDRSALRAAAFILSAWIGLLLLELVGITVAVDFGSLWGELNSSSWWQRVVSQAGQIPRVLIASAVAALVHGGLAWRDELLRCSDTNRTFRAGLMVRFLLHAAVFGAFAILSIKLAAINFAKGQPVVIFLWLGFAALVGLSWVSILLPPVEWRGFLQRRGGSLLVGLAVGLVAWGAGLATEKLWKPMAFATLQIVRMLITPFSRSNLVYDASDYVIGTEDYAVRIAPACSGYEGIGLVWVILGSYLWFFRNEMRFPRSLILLPLGTIFIWLANALRIAVLIEIGIHVSPTIASGGFHSQAGWIALNVVIFGLILIAGRVSWLRKQPANADRVADYPAAPYLLPLVAMVGLMMATAALTEGFDRFYFVRGLGAGILLLVYRKRYSSLGLNSPFIASVAGLLVLGIWLGLERADVTAGETLRSHVMAMSSISRIAWIAARVIGSCLVVPFVEEIALRGFFARRIEKEDFEAVDPRTLSPIAIVVSSLAFGAMHQRFIAGSLAGLVYGLVYRYRGSLGDAVLAHAVTNSVIAGLVLFGGEWYLWT